MLTLAQAVRSASMTGLISTPWRGLLARQQ
jgi:hypothetical protein